MGSEMCIRDSDLAGIQCLVQFERGIGDHGAQTIGIGEELGHHRIRINGTAVIDLDQQVVFDIEGALDLLPKNTFVENILNPDAHAVDLVGVRRANSAPGRANLALAQEALGDLIECAVVLRDDVRIGADPKTRDVDAT